VTLIHDTGRPHVASGRVVWSVIAAASSLLAVICALITVHQTVKLRREAQLQTLADALIAVISAAEKHPGKGDAVWDARLADAVRQVERATALSILGLSKEITAEVMPLLEPSNRSDPEKMFLHATNAFQTLRT